MIKYDIEISNEALASNLKRITNQIYKLLPNREEGIDWESPLATIMEELAGMDRLFIDHQDVFFPLICKLEGLFSLTSEEDFFLYRRTIFECLSLVGQVKKVIIGY
jgi:hypothetical protein